MSDHSHRHSTNPYAIAHMAHTLPSAPIVTMPQDGWTTRVDKYIARLHITHIQNMTRPGCWMPNEFIRQVHRGPLKDYEVLLHCPEITPTDRELASMMTTYADAQNDAALLAETEDALHLYDPPSNLSTPSPMTTDQFMDLFSVPTTAELFIAAHRWPDGIPQCPRCRSRHATVARNSAPRAERIEHLTIPIGPDLIWKCSICGVDFIATDGTIMADMNLPPQDWLYITMNVIQNPRPRGEYAGPITPSDTFYGSEISHHEARQIHDRINSLFPAEPVANTLEALKVLVTATPVTDG